MELSKEEEKRYYTFLIITTLMLVVISGVLGYRVYEYIGNKDAQKLQAEIMTLQPEAESSCYCTIKLQGQDNTNEKQISITNCRNIRLHQLINIYYSAKNDKVFLENEFGFASSNILLTGVLFLLTLVIIYARLFPHNIAEALNRPSGD